MSDVPPSDLVDPTGGNVGQDYVMTGLTQPSNPFITELSPGVGVEYDQTGTPIPASDPLLQTATSVAAQLRPSTTLTTPQTVTLPSGQVVAAPAANNSNMMLMLGLGAAALVAVLAMSSGGSQSPQ